MSKILNVVVPAALLFSALALSACATKPEVAPIAAPAQVEVITETPPAPAPAPEPAPVAVPEPAPAPAAITAQPAPKQVAAKKKVAKHTPPKAAPPVAAPAAIAPAALPPPEPGRPVTTTALPAKKVAEAGFLERYWLWLLGLLGVVIAGVVVWRKQT